MNIIVPAIIPTSREDLEDKLLRLQGISEGVQIDLVDGEFAGPPSWPYLTKKQDTAFKSLDTADFLGGLHMEMDLMVHSPEKIITPWINAGANRITIHAGSTPTLTALFDEIQTRYGHDTKFNAGLLSIGIALHADADLAILDPLISRIDYVQFMGIASIGKQGQPFDSRVLPKMRAFKKKYPAMPMQVDGGVSLQTAPALLSAGASRLIIGSALWKSASLAETYKQFIELTTSYGLYT